MAPEPVRLLYLTAEQWPTFRADLVALFGKYLPRHGVVCDLATERAEGGGAPPWPAGRAIVCPVPAGRAGQYVAKFFHLAKVLIGADTVSYTHLTLPTILLV